MAVKDKFEKKLIKRLKLDEGKHDAIVFSYHQEVELPCICDAGLGEVL